MSTVNRTSKEFRYFSFANATDMAAYPFTASDIPAILFNEQTGNVHYLSGTGIGATTSWSLACIRQVPKQIAFAASMTIDCSQGNSFQITDIVTSDFSLTLTNGVDGDSGTISYKQAAAGGKKCTGITVTGRTKEMDDLLTTINTTNALVANTHCILTYAFFTTGTDLLVRFWMNTGTAASFA